MREIEINGRTFKVRSLKRKEIKALRKQGFILIDLKPENAEEAQDKVFEMVFGPDDIAAIDEMDNRDVMILWRAILAETYGAPEEEKNS